MKDLRKRIKLLDKKMNYRVKIIKKAGYLKKKKKTTVPFLFVYPRISITLIKTLFFHFLVTMHERVMNITF